MPSQAISCRFYKIHCEGRLFPGSLTTTTGVSFDLYFSSYRMFPFAEFGPYVFSKGDPFYFTVVARKWLFVFVTSYKTITKVSTSS